MAGQSNRKEKEGAEAKTEPHLHRREKAFDSVSHQSIVRAAHRLGTPPFMLRCISEAYRNCSVQLKIGGRLSQDICSFVLLRK